jgi:hypothetical protein
MEALPHPGDIQEPVSCRDQSRALTAWSWRRQSPLADVGVGRELFIGVPKELNPWARKGQPSPTAAC